MGYRFPASGTVFLSRAPFSGQGEHFSAVGVPLLYVIGFVSNWAPIASNRRSKKRRNLHKNANLQSTSPRCVEFVGNFQFTRKPRMCVYQEPPQAETNRFRVGLLSVGGPLGKLAVRPHPMEFPCEFCAKAPARRLYSRFPGISKGVVNYGKRGRNNRHRWAVSVGRVHVRRRFGSFRPRAPYILRSYPVALADESIYGRSVR